jgi:H2-forming N5,N10-methylenetetrahydromethanopterin dehydrogenase-like enzyme
MVLEEDMENIWRWQIGKGYVRLAIRGIQNVREGGVADQSCTVSLLCIYLKTREW